MVDIEKAKKEFEKYYLGFKIDNIKVEGKIDHSYRVMELSTQLAQNQNLEEEMIEVATLIGLLHDIARFEQFEKYKTFRDVDSIDHGEFGAEILKKDAYIRNYIKTDKYDEIIFKAIKNHNKLEIEQNLSKQEELFCKIIRDADKLDIFYEAAEMFWEDSKKAVEDLQLSPYIVDEINREKQIERKKGKILNELDKMVSILSFVYDLNFSASFKIIKDNDYINRIINQFDFKDEKTKMEIEKIRKLVNQYIEKNQ